ncbi:MAG: protein translocase subunit SecF, partial [Gammaproteobacteria bacterium]|nr:protein translocase subunit SecF [Gammaproteobacteria bacterium]
MEFLQAQTTIDFLGRRRSAALISGLVIVISIASMAVRGLNFGIDFTGGTLVEVAYSEPVAIADVRAALNSAQIESALVQHFGTASDVMIRLPAGTDDTAQLSSTVVAALRDPFGESLDETRPGQVQQCVMASGGTEDCHVQMRRVEFVGPQVGDELTEQGTLAMLYALLGILVYVAWRFEWRFAVGSVAALVHDVVI